MILLELLEPREYWGKDVDRNIHLVQIQSPQMTAVKVSAGAKDVASIVVMGLGTEVLSAMVLSAEADSTKVLSARRFGVMVSDLLMVLKAVRFLAWERPPVLTWVSVQAHRDGTPFL